MWQWHCADHIYTIINNSPSPTQPHTWRKEKDDADIAEHLHTFKNYDEVNSSEYFTCLTHVWNTQLCSSCAGSDWTMGCSCGIFSCFRSDDAIRTCFYMTRCQQVRQEEGDHSAGHTLLISARLKCLKLLFFTFLGQFQHFFVINTPHQQQGDNEGIPFHQTSWELDQTWVKQI